MTRVQLSERTRRAKAGLRPAFRGLTQSRRALPDFVIIGAQKAGTTSLMRYLQAHPDVVTEPGVGEVHFFDNNWERGEPYYRAHFPFRRALEHKRALTGEKTPFYLFHPLAPERAATLVPRAKLIALLRNPTERAASQHKMNVNMGTEPLDFAAAIDAEPERIAESFGCIADGTAPAPGEPANLFSYVARGRYAEQLDRWLEHFPREQLLILRSEDLADDPESTYARALEFLQLAPHRPEFVRHNQARKAYAIEPATRQRLDGLFREPNRQLAERFAISW